ncbi:MAG: aminotransferase class I/II-fold pyridoxal phosphate-dependent enzyme [Flavobacteriaceae bacterium]|nr:MAG: aminotransferase class I/II-fold pyridoxal phosphate-dependent enzyme [Flavobacteriaceae bacterium]
MRFPKKLDDKLEKRTGKNAMRTLQTRTHLIDFSSNDYLGIAASTVIFDRVYQYLLYHNIKANGATGSRLLSGNHRTYVILEKTICEFHASESATVYNSGYNANIGFFSAVPQRGDIILYDEFIHASIRDGIKISNAESYKFRHNDLKDLDKILKYHMTSANAIAADKSKYRQEIFVVTEAVFSMDGDTPDFIKMIALVKKNNAFLVVDEAHAVGVFGRQGQGICQDIGMEKDVFARIITFGKALGCHGAAILGNEKLKQYLVNFSRSFIYTTALPPHTIATVYEAYHYLKNADGDKKRQALKERITFFKKEIIRLQLQHVFITSNSTIQSCIIPGNQKVKNIAQKLQKEGFDVRPILSPTISENEERLRFCLHSYNSKEEIRNVLELLAIFVAG